MKLWTRRPRVLALAVGIAAVAGSAPFVLANDDGVMDFIRSGQSRPPAAARPPAPAPFFAPAPVFAPAPPSYFPRSQAALPSPAPMRPARPAPRPRTELARATDALPRSAEDGVKLSLSELGARAVCVRMCDGYHFPAGDVASGADVPAQEALCQARCPSAPVKLFTVEAGREIEDARRGNQLYRNLPNAFAHQRAVSAACSCEGGPTQAKRVSLLKDMTLKKGDVVVLADGAKVFNGAERWPYKGRDFSDLRSSKVLGVVAQKQVERVVGLAPPTPQRSLRGRGKPLDPVPASGGMADVEATGSVPAEGSRKVRVIYTATDRYVAPEGATQAMLP